MKTQRRIIAAILSVMMILTALPLATFAQIAELTDDGVQESAYAGVKIDSARIISEDDARRSENEKHFKLDDGTYLAVKYGYPIHTQNEIGEWENIDLSFAASENAGADVYISETDALSAAVTGGSTMQLVSAEDMYPVSLTLTGFDMASTEKQVEEETEIDETSIYEENIKAIESAIKSHVLHFADATQDAGLTYERTYASVRQSIVIDHEIENHSLSFALNTGDLTAVLDDSGGVEIKDGEEVKYTLPAPYMYDSENHNFSLLRYSLEAAEDGGYILTINPDDALLNSEDVTYPVTVSAAVTVPCEKINRMTAVSSDTPDMSYTGENIRIGRTRTDEDKVTRAFFDAEDLPALTKDDIMLSAQLHADLCYLNSEADSFALEAYSVTESWDTDSVTWNNQPAYSDEAKECTVHETGSVFAPSEWDITKEVRNRYDGEVAYGIVFVSSDETTDGAAYVGEFSPYLLLNYVSVSQNSAEEPLSPSDIVESDDSALPPVSEEIADIDAADNIEDAVVMDNAAASYAATKTFKEITSELTIEYCTNDRDNFTSLPSGKDVANLCGIRIGTNNSNFYLKYKSTNGDQLNWLDSVYSTKSGIYDYAGLPNKPMTQLSIEVYTAGGTRIYDDYVVMYRAKVQDHGWLNWVSNGDSTVMHTIQGDYPDEITGGLDTGYYDIFAGWAPYGNIQALEIRMFERIEGNTSSSGGSSGTVGDGDFQIASGITMEYYKNRTWYPLTANVSVDSMDGVRLQTNGKPYYLWYRSRDADHGWLDFVSSDNSGVYDYAGWPDYPMSNLEIRVYTQGGTRIFDDYVVMYRAKVSGRGWLDWVSNGNPPVMEAIKTQFGLLGGLDTAATEAGWAASDKIEALDIRVYERKGMNPTPSKNAVLIDAPYINQFDENLPNGCESASTVMALQHAVGTDKISLKAFLYYLDWTPDTPSPSRNSGPNPNEVYMGNPFPGSNAYSWGCFSPVIMKAVGKLKKVIGVKATDVSGTSLNSLCTSYIDKNIPVIMWATVGMTSSYTVHHWDISDGESISYNNKLHCLLLIGYDENNYYFNDPMAKKIQGYSKASVEAAYAALGKQAIVITKETSGSGSSGGQTVAPPKDTTVKDSVEIPKTPALKDEYHADPIDLSTGAHVIDHTLMTISGAQTLSFNISYRSNVLTEGSAGKGWSHNFEKKIADDGDTVYVYDNPAYYAIYKKSASDSGVYTTDTVTKVNYILTKIDDGYIINCNYGSTEYYNSVGQLTKITGKTGLNTLITYPNDSTVRITDEISGRYIQLAKNSDGKITSVTDNMGRTCTLGYIDGCLVSITDENGEILSYQYNEKGQIERGRDQNGIIYFTDTYDSAGRVISQKDAMDDSAETVIRYDETTDPDYLLVSVTDRTMQTTVYKYNDQKQLVSKTDPNGVNARYTYDSHGNLTRKSDGLGSTTVNVYDTRDNLISTSNKRGYKTVYKYDAKNNLTKISYPGGSYVTKTYDSNNLLISGRDLRGVTTTYTYNAQNLLTKVSYAGRTVTYAYTKGQPTTVTDPMGRTTTKVYNEAGFLMSVTDAQNNTTSYTYDNKGNVLTVTDAEGNVTAKEYDAGGSLIKSTDAKGNSTSYTYNGNLKMTSMTLPNGKTIRYAYDGEDRLVKTTYPDGTTAENTYDAGGRLISQTDRDGNTTAYAYDAANKVKKITNPEGGVIQQEHDSEGNLTKIKEPLTIYDQYYYFDYPEEYDEDDMEWAMTNVTVTNSYVYDINGRMIKSVNSQGGETVYTYNAAGDLLTVTDPMGNKTINTYDSLGNLLTVTDPRGNKTTYTYDKAGNLLTVKNALNQITRNTYDSLNRLVSTKDPSGHLVSYTYDALGRMTAQTDARGNTTTQEYDALGNIVKITNASGHVDYQAVYDNMSNATQVTNSAGSKTTNVYDWEGNLTKETNAMNQSASYTYDGAGQMISAVDKAGGVSYATYDGIGNLTSMTGPGGNEKAYAYDSTGRMFRKGSTGADYKDNYYYNAAGLLDTVTKAWFYYETHYTYDLAGRITEWKDGDGTRKYTYDANGNVIAVSDATGTVRREYDALNRVTKYTDIYDQTILYEYDSCGNLTKMTYPTGEKAVYTYDANHNMLSSGVEGEEYTTTYEYNERNQVTKVKNIDGGTVTKNYDNAGRLVQLTDKDKTGKILFINVFMYDVLGRITSELNPLEMIGYRMTYDSLGRMTQREEYDLQTNEALHTETFTYDSAGNILTAVSPDGTTNTYEYNQDNFISKMNNDGIGVTIYGETTTCMINGKKVNLTYDARNRLKKIDGNNNEFWYDADNNRINMSYYDTNIKYAYDCSGGRSRLVWTSDHNENVTSYFYGAEGLLWSRCDGEYQIYHYDYRGSVVAVTDIDGNVTDTLKYDAYGSTIERTGDSALIFGYNGQYGVLTDPNGLLYMRTRFYNPQLKRFMNADIIDGSIADSTSLNLYTFVNGNPISFVDPFGLSAERGNNSGFELGWEFNPGPSDYIGWGLDGQEIGVRTYNYARYGFNVDKVGQYAIIKGARSNPALSQGIKGTRYAFKNADVYPNVFSYVDPITAGKEALKPISQGSVNWGSVLGYGTVALDVGLGIYDNIQDGTRTQKIVTDAIVDTGVGVGAIWASAAAGAAIGSVAPGPGNAIGAVGGFVVGGTIYIVTDVITINDKSLVDWGKEGLGWVGDRTVEIGCWIGDTASDIGSWIIDKWDAIW